MVVERMSKVDTAWLRMDSETNLMMILGVWVVKPSVSYEAVCQRIEERLLQYPRFGQRVEPDAMGANWVTVKNFDIRRHVVIETLPAESKRREQQALQGLQARLAELAVQPLDMAHPLWQFHLVENYQGGSALMARIHHCIADGIALIAVTQSMIDGGTEPLKRHRNRSENESAGDWISDTLIRPLTDVAVNALDAAGEGAVNAMEMLIEPKKGFEKGLRSSTPFW